MKKIRSLLGQAVVFSGFLGFLGGCAGTTLYQPKRGGPAAMDTAGTTREFLRLMSQARLYSSGGSGDNDWTPGWARVEGVAPFEDGTGAKIKMESGSQNIASLTQPLINMESGSQKIVSTTQPLIFQDVRGIKVKAAGHDDPYYVPELPYDVEVRPSDKVSTRLYFPFSALEDAKAFADILSTLSITTPADIAAAVKAKALEDRQKAEAEALAGRVEVKAAQERQARIDRVLRAEEAGLADEVAKDYRGAFHKYLSALQSLVDGLPIDVKPRILRRLLKVSGQLKPPAAIPKEATDFDLRGQQLMNDDFQKAEQDLQIALKAAPWWADAYFHLAQVQESLGKIAEAKQDLQWFLMAKPHTRDTELVKKMIARLETETETPAAK